MVASLDRVSLYMGGIKTYFIDFVAEILNQHTLSVPCTNFQFNQEKNKNASEFGLGRCSQKAIVMSKLKRLCPLTISSLVLMGSSGNKT